MSQHFGKDEKNDLSPTRPTTGFSRRTLLGGSVALIGSLLLKRTSGAQNLGFAVTSSTEVNGPKTLPHEFGLRKPVPTRAPLAPAAFLALPLGSVKARGWLLKQLELQRDGLTGNADKILDCYPATSEDSAWKGGEGEDWEKGPYYLKGLTSLAYTLDDPAMKEKVQSWIEPIIASQRPDGYFGPMNDDWWPRMVATYLLRDYAEATGDARVNTLLTNYYKHMEANLPKRPLVKWGKARAGDEIDTVFWLYNRTGDEFLLPLADLLAKQALPWTAMFTDNTFALGKESWMGTHNVNVPQALKMPVLYSQRSKRKEDREAYRAGLTHLMRDHGSSFGINTGTEALSGRSSLEGVETCSTVEYLLSAETALQILGDARIGDELELVAFNALPAAFSKDFKQHVYYTLSNNVHVKLGKVGYAQDHGNDRLVAPQSGFACCCYNMHMGWPKLAQNAWASTSIGGLALMTYVPSEVTAPVAGGKTVTFTCETNYPFEETVSLKVKADAPAKFSLHLRVPGWCAKPEIKVNGSAVKNPKPGSFTQINREWKAGDRVEIAFPMTVQVERGINNSASVRRGPLVFALGLNEKKTIVATNQLPGYESYELTSDSTWNYALEINESDPSAFSFKVVPRKSSDNPFETGEVPIVLQVQARRIDEWTMRPDGQLSMDPPASPVRATGALQTLELVPFGSQMLKISEFPVVGTPKTIATTWSEEFDEGYSNRWIVYRGGYLREGKLFLPKTSKGIASETMFSDVSFEGDVIIGKSGDAGFLLRVSKASIGVDHYQGYYVGLNAENDVVFLGKANYNYRHIEKASRPLEAGKVYRVKVEAMGAQIKVWVNDMTVPVLEATDSTYKQGHLGVRSYGTGAAFAKLKARAI